MIDDITKSLASLSVQELQTLRSRINALLDLSGAGGPAEDEQRVTSPDADSRMMIECICEVLSSAGVEHMTPYTLSRLRVRSFQRKVAATMEFIKRAHPTKTGHRALLIVGIKLLYDDLIRMNIPVSGQTVMNHTHRIPAVLNHAFPGYAQAGMLRAIVHDPLNPSSI